MDIIKLDNSDNIEKIEYNDKTIFRKKYGVIRITGENFLREVKYETYKYLKKLPANFTGLVEIPELKLTIPVNQIVKLEEKESETIEYKNFTKFPTETVFLDLDFNYIDKNKIKLEEKYDEYYIATCHYVKNGDEKQYYLNIDQIKRLILMKRDMENIGYPHYIAKTWSYGISPME